MPDIEDYIGEKITVTAITEDVISNDIITPEKRPPRRNKYQGRKTGHEKTHTH
jgi:hypothetical protein